ncbi:MAG: PLP-dependent aminotransferase family protein [bacterium]|nr:PLP-dependent aminotransferase family protein [bacterium]
MFLSIDKSVGVPVYQQIRDGIIALIKANTLATGDKLPGTRELASQLGVSRKTVLIAYLELAADSWVESRPGSSTFVLDRTSLTHPAHRRHPSIEVLPPMELDGPRMDWSPFEFDSRYFNMPPNRDKWSGTDEWISFARAIPDVRLFPFERIKKVSGQMLWDPKAYFFDYGHPQGYQPLVEYLSMRLAKEGVNTNNEVNGVVIASGFQVSLNLLLSMLVKPGETVAVEEPTFNSILNLLDASRIAHRGIPMEHDGMDVDYLERMFTRGKGEKPSLIITIPTLHNPTGTTMSREKREALIKLAQRHNVPIIEDAWSMLMPGDGRREPSLKTLDTGGHVIQIGSFSKCFLPGTRVAWIVLPADIAVSFVRAKRALDRSDSYFLQTLVYEFIKKGYLDLHLRKVERIYRARRELMDDLMRQQFPSDVSWKRPSGGLSFWVSLPGNMSSRDLLERAVEMGIEFAPGNFFYTDRRDGPFMRLSFSTLTQPQLRQGVRRLGVVIQRAMLEHSRRTSLSAS